MLTETDEQWLAEREWGLVFMGSYSCGLCQYRDPDDLLCVFRTCPKFKEDYQDAAEFSAHVAAKLVGELQYECVCPSCQYNTHGCRTARMSYKQCRLKHARLAVEAEMEAENAGR